MVTNCTGASNSRLRKGGKSKDPCATVKFGSASVPIYRSQSNGRTRYFLCYHRDGKRMRQAFPDLVAAKKEAQFVAQRIQSGMQHVTDLKPHERDNYKAAEAMLQQTGIPLDLERRIIEIRAGQAKTASRRIVPITDNLAVWLEPLERKGKVVKAAHLHVDVTALARALKLKWPRNVLRHSFISYRIATVKSADQVALEAGNSPSIIFKHYRELTTEDRAEKWFAIMPKHGQLENT